ncbi:DODA-type extradiol aromatic ring-opening family dioxygenase [Luteimonas dalianensis]|uniref:DODA-type extradiol aromatic ring-opening family dioxygenase n=1 Tax=Luteimonas dalianensis TaxID=1148196 RepID=UPI003BEFEF04
MNTDTIPTDSSAAAPGRGARMPTFFLPHGAGPCFFMDWNPADTWDAMAAFLKGIADTLPATPRAIVLVSGHWLEQGFSLTGHARPPLIYDYSGFPAHTYELAYPAPGDPELAARIAGLLGQAGEPGRVDPGRGFDHGVFIPLKLAFPGADIPVVQLSLRRDMDPAAHLQAGRALADLRDEGVLVIGSGMSFHNMRGYGDPRYTPVSAKFDEWLTAAVESEPGQRETLLRDWASAPHARDSHPPGGEEHLLPLMVAAGAAGDSPGRKVYSEEVMKTTLSAFRFG